MFKGKVVAYWKFGEHRAEVQWTMRQPRTDLTTEVIQINKKKRPFAIRTQ